MKADLQRGIHYSFNETSTIDACYRPFVKCYLYFNQQLNEMQYQLPVIFGSGKIRNRCIAITDATAQKPWMVCAVEQVTDLHFVGAAAGTVCIPFQRLTLEDALEDNITNWALKQFKAHYKTLAPSPQPSPGGRGSRRAPRAEPQIDKEAIFHYCYAVLHDPLYREKYALNLKREFPRIPFYANFWQWADWGRQLMDLHLGYETVEPYPLQRTDIPDDKARAAGLAPKALLRADPAAGRILVDSETTLHGIPPEVWNYRLGNRGALDWILDQYKERKPRDPTIRERFNTYRFSDYKEWVIDLLGRVTRVSLETLEIMAAMRAAER